MFAGRFAGKAAVVTGAAGGIGRAIAQRLAAEGAGVLLADVNEEAGRAAAGAIGPAALFVRADVTSAADCAAMVEQAVRSWGGLDVLVNSAGIGASARVAAADEALWDRVLDTNLKGVFLACRAAFPALVDRGGGAIVNLASLAALIVAPGMGVYAASKAGVVQLTRSLAVEGARFRIRANALCPTWVDTPMLRNYVEAQPDPDAAWGEMARMIPLGRIATVEDAAAAALFLASDEAAFLTGLALPIDGGQLCS